MLIIMEEKFITEEVIYITKYIYIYIKYIVNLWALKLILIKSLKNNRISNYLFKKYFNYLI